MSEIEIRRSFGELSRRTAGARDTAFFLGAGLYHHYVSAIADQMLYRSEWLTSYTPYQPEVSQGTLQSIFEFQTHIGLLTGLDVANASLYEGASALVEALLMASGFPRTAPRRSLRGNPSGVSGNGSDLLRELGSRDRRGSRGTRRRDRSPSARRGGRRSDFRRGSSIPQLLRPRGRLEIRPRPRRPGEARSRSRSSPKPRRSPCSLRRGRPGSTSPAVRRSPSGSRWITAGLCWDSSPAGLPTRGRSPGVSSERRGMPRGGAPSA
jgi:hypothetical protein